MNKKLIGLYKQWDYPVFRYLGVKLMMRNIAYIICQKMLEGDIFVT